MAPKLKFSPLPLYAALVVALILVFVLSRKESSPFAKGAQWMSNLTEGFSVRVLQTPQCPFGYKFFNDARGDSFCCAGSVNPYSHRCTDTRVQGLCAFKPGQPDPRDPKRTLVLCSDLISSTARKDSSNFCPSSLPNFADIGKCCLTSPDMDGRDCSEVDNKDFKRYCRVSGTLLPGEQSCANLRLFDQTTCPKGLVKLSYPFGDREVAKYGQNAKNLQMPVCFGMDAVCMPDKAIQEVQRHGVFADKKDLASWKYACSGYEKRVIRRDMTGQYNEAYL